MERFMKLFIAVHRLCRLCRCLYVLESPSCGRLVAHIIQPSTQFSNTGPHSDQWGHEPQVTVSFKQINCCQFKVSSLREFRRDCPMYVFLGNTRHHFQKPHCCILAFDWFSISRYTRHNESCKRVKEHNYVTTRTYIIQRSHLESDSDYMTLIRLLMWQCFFLSCFVLSHD